MSTIAAANSAKPVSLRIPVARGLLYLLVLSFPFFSIEPKIFQPDWWIGGSFIAVSAFSVLARRRLRLDPIGRAVLWFNGAVILSTAVNLWDWGAAQWAEFLTLWLQLVFASLLYFALANLKCSMAQMRFLLRLWVGGAVVVALYGLYQTLARNFDLPLAYLPCLHSEPSPQSVEWGLGFAGYIRPSSVLREPTYFGRYLIAPLVMVATLVFFKKDKIWLFRVRGLNLAILMLISAAIIASFALASYITLALLVLMAGLLGCPGRKFAVRFALIIILLFASLAIALQGLNIPLLNSIQERFLREIVPTLRGDVGYYSTAVRLQEAVLALNTWLHHPFVGVGLNQQQFIGQMYVRSDLPSWIVEQGYIHNIWLEVLVQLGIVGFLLFGIIWLRALRTMRETFQHRNETIKWVGLAFSYVLLATMINGFEGGPFTFPLYWFYLGISSIVYRLGLYEH